MINERMMISGCDKTSKREPLFASDGRFLLRCEVNYKIIHRHLLLCIVIVPRMILLLGGLQSSVAGHLININL